MLLGKKVIQTVCRHFFGGGGRKKEIKARYRHCYWGRRGRRRYKQSVDIAFGGRWGKKDMQTVCRYWGRRGEEGDANSLYILGE